MGVIGVCVVSIYLNCVDMCVLGQGIRLLSRQTKCKELTYPDDLICWQNIF